MSQIYTRCGDSGHTDTIRRKRISKADPQIELLGSLDEASAHIGFARAFLNGAEPAALLQKLQETLICVSAEAAGGKPFDDAAEIAQMESLIDGYGNGFHGFVTIGKTPAGAALNIARTVVRRSERVAVTLHRQGMLRSGMLGYFNRLSDLLYVLAGYVELKDTITDVVKDVMQMPPEYAKDAISQSTAIRLTREIEAQAEKMGVKTVVIIVDAGGRVKSLSRMDGAFVASLDIAEDKAYTAFALKMPTTEVAKEAQAGKSLEELAGNGHNHISMLGGGVPLVKHGIVQGGLGVSGGTAEQDIQLAKYGMDIYQTL